MKQLVMALLTCVLSLGLIGVGCRAPENAENALKEEGYTDIKLGFYDYTASFAHPIGCGVDDLKTRFAATNQAGERKTGVVCTGLFMNTVNLDWFQ